MYSLNLEIMCFQEVSLENTEFNDLVKAIRKMSRKQETLNTYKFLTEHRKF